MIIITCDVSPINTADRERDWAHPIPFCDNASICESIDWYSVLYTEV